MAQSHLIGSITRLFKLRHSKIAKTSAGIENWEDTEEGRLLTRQANMHWLIREFERNGMVLESRVAGQFTEIYWLVPTRLLKRWVHAFNTLWFRYIRAPGPAFGNILIFRKRA